MPVPEVPAEKTLLIGLDRDGTLVPYTLRPEEAIMPPYTAWLVRQLSALPNIHVALISARGTNRLSRDVASGSVILAGNYGLEVKFPGAGGSVHPLALRAVPELRVVKEELANLAKQVPNLSVEDHGYSLNLSYIAVPDDQREFVHQRIAALETELKTLELHPMSTNYEFFPTAEWDKAMAFEKIETALSLKPGNYFPIFLGDSFADEAAFVWTNKRGGLSVKVGFDGSPTQALKQLKDPEEAATFLEEIRNRRTPK